MGEVHKDVLYLTESSTYAHYKPGADFQWTNPQITDEFTVNWRFSVDHMAWTEEEILLNVPDGMSAKGLKTIYKRLKRIKEMRLWTSLIHGMEDDLAGNPHGAVAEAAMEQENGDTPYSLFAFVNEESNGLPDTWTTKEQLNPSNLAGWVPQQVQYDANDPADGDDDRDGLINAFDDMWLLVQFKPPGTRNEYFENVMMSRQMIAASRIGINVYKDLLRELNDNLSGAASRSDPAYNEPMYSGIPLFYWPALDTAAIYTNGSTFTELEGASAATNTGSRYYWFNMEYIKPIWHTQRYMYRHEPMRHPNQPFTWVTPVNCYWNLVCSSMRRQGIVYPGA